ncbi:LytR/AlgR family response regulator transcription factor [Winogradskyella bathintestinalis]|uniref:LytTR family DNA-binding domain-containing protein n=1 Tax=Winogradskyella bathintestinalis TaxID=3035208 RepID=A0ABT7ZVX4_9FLAO|nr:LytTR family DNA-binding domain-containing protein [Winogradskyella bathintestinalis]MDN3493117.1 LytTR family DNA-binding domain-containing protein [Winogradskyella bathintestinalis]
MISTIIIEDEAHCSDRILNLINQHPNMFKVLKVIDNIDDALEMVPKLQPELVFLDIRVNDKTGFDFLQNLASVNFKVIFTTAFDNFAIKAFKFSAIDYLLKPIDTDDFNDAVARLKKNMSTSNMEQQFQNLFRNLKPDQKKVITIPSLTGFETLKIEDIIHMEADTSYTHIFTKTQKILVSKPIKFYEDLLANNSFFKTHKSHLINLENVKKYYKGKQSYVLMSNDAQVPISVRRKEEFLKQFN